MAEIDDLDTTDANNSARFPEGQNPSTVNDGARALEGMLARAWFDAVEPASITASASTSNAWNITPNRSITCAQGLRLCFVAPAGNSGAVTIDIGDGKGAHALEQANGSAFSGGEIPKDQFVEAMFEASASVWQALSYAGITASSTDTLTNKTLTSPTINAPTLTLQEGSAPSAEGLVRWDSANDRIRVGNGAGASEFISNGEYSSTANGKGSALIGSEDASGYFTGTTVEAILQELGAALPNVGFASATFDMTTASSGTTDISSFGFDPNVFAFLYSVSGVNDYRGHGFFVNGSGQGSFGYQGSGVSTASTAAILATAGAGTNQSLSASAITGGVRLTNTKTGSPTGTLTIKVLAAKL